MSPLNLYGVLQLLLFFTLGKYNPDGCKMNRKWKTGYCGGRVVILLYCPSYFLMETGLYW